MPNVAAIWPIALAVILGLPAVATGAQAPTPRITIDPPAVDLGAVTPSEPARARFVITNDGAGTLKITSIETRCGCIAALLSSAELPPGETATLVATLDPAHINGSESNRIVIHSNDPDLPITSVVVHATGEWPFHLSAPVMHFGNVPVGEPQTRSITLSPTGKNPVALTRAWTDSAYVTVETKPDAHTSDTHVVARLHGDAPPGALHATLHLTFEGATPEHVLVPIRGTVAGRVQVEPHALGLGYLHPGETGVRRLKISAPGVNKFSVSKITTRSPFLSPTLEQTGNNTYSVSVAVAPDAAQGPHQDALVIHTNVRGESEVVVPVAAIIR